MKIERHGRRFWAVFEADGTLVCVCVYLKGAREVIRRLTEGSKPAEPANR